MVFNNNLLLGAAGAGGGYTIDQSIRFNDNDSAYLSRAMGTGGDTKTGTLSLWVKRANLGTTQWFFSQIVSLRNSDISFNSDDTIRFYLQETAGAGYALHKTSSNVYRDVGGWYHIYATWDTTQSSPEWNLYVNGVQPTWATDSNNGMSQNANIAFFGNSNMDFGRHSTQAIYYTDAYLAEINCIEGSVVAISEFAETNADTGQWVPKKYTGSYPGKSFYITGADSADLGADDSGNGNDFTSSGLTAADQMLDTPSNNFATLNPLWKGSNTTLSEGNLKANQVADDQVGGTFYFDVEDTNYYYAEFVFSSSPNSSSGVGLIKADTSMDVSGGNANTYWYFASGNKRNVSGVSYGSSYTTGDVIGVAVGNGSVTFYKNNVSQGEAFTGLSGSFTIGCGEFNSTSGSMHMNFGQDSSFAGTKTAQGNTDENGRGDFYYTPPSGYLALCTANLPDPTIADPSAYFQTTLYTGNGTAIGSGGNAVDQSGNSTFQPDFVWIKNREAGDNHMLYDAVRGATKDLHSNSTAAEVTDTEGLSTFDTDGFTVGSNVEVNTNTENYVAWQWAADGTSGSSNTDGSITSTVSAGTSGFSIVSYTGTGANATVGHGLGVAPKMIIIKNRPDADNWIVYHEAMGATKGLSLNAASAPTTAVTYFNNTAPTSSVFSIGSGGGTNGSGDAQIAYCFAEVEGFSKIGKYTGNGSTDGTFVYTGFKPAFVLWKQFTNLGTNNFIIRDSAREPYNVVDTVLFPNTTAGDTTDLLGYGGDLLSNGFKLRGTDGAVNKAASDYLYLAFAESPFKTATAR